MSLKTVQKDLEDLKLSINLMSTNMETLTKQQTTIKDLLEEIKKLKSQNKEQEDRIGILENRVSDLEQYSRMKDVIISAENQTSELPSGRERLRD